MAWATRADLAARFSTSAIDEMESAGAIVAVALSDAEAEVAGYVGKAVALPLATVPDTLVRLVCIVARYNLWQRQLADDHPAYVAYREAVKELRDIADGRIILPINSGTGETTTDGTFAVKTRAPVFTDTVFAGMVL